MEHWVDRDGCDVAVTGVFLALTREVILRRLGFRSLVVSCFAPKDLSLFFLPCFRLKATASNSFSFAQSF